MPNPKSIALRKKGWRVNEFAAELGCGHATIWSKIAEGKIRSVKIGGMRIITESPDEYLARHEVTPEL